MYGPIPQTLSPWIVENAASQIGLRRWQIIGLIALAATALWAPLLYLGSWEVGVSFDARWWVPLLLTIFVFLLLGLNMAPIASQALSGNNTDLPPAA